MLSILRRRGLAVSERLAAAIAREDPAVLAAEALACRDEADLLAPLGRAAARRPSRADVAILIRSSRRRRGSAWSAASFSSRAAMPSRQGQQPSRAQARPRWRGSMKPVFDTHAIARALADANLTPAQVDAITDAVRQAAEHETRDLVTRADLYRALLLQTGVLIGAGIAVLRLLG